MNERYEENLERELAKELKREERTEQALGEARKLEHQLEEELQEERKDEAEIERKIESARHHDRVELIFVLNGEDYPLHVGADEPLVQAVEKALSESGNSGRRNPADWELRDAAGALLDMQRTAKELHLLGGTKLFLSPRVGAGG